MEKKKTILFLFWCISLILCILVEIFYQSTFNIKGIGIICALFMSILIKEDLELIRRN
jgi:FtsH-binding integral membrane protein